MQSESKKIIQINSLFKDCNCLRWNHFHCFELSKHEFGFDSNNKEPFYRKSCVKHFELIVIDSDKLKKKDFFYRWITVYEDYFKRIHLDCNTVSNNRFQKICNNDLS